ncbi:uncharacterized protein VTP21DRAFT_2212 [Calcarisporiella thermophila]|uniref:uncharacterized protein n=1 Tax=Calcarisporiella thermophila TaxID=911321 RepID=UPI003743C91E
MVDLLSSMGPNRIAAASENEDNGPHSNIALGILVIILTSLVQSLGMTIQRKSHIMDDMRPEGLRRHALRRPLWLLGFLAYVGSNFLGSVFGLALLPVIIIGPLSSIGLIFNAIFAKLLLAYNLTPQAIVGTIFIAAGAVLIGIFGATPDHNRDLSDLIELYKRPVFITLYSLEDVFILVVLLVTTFAERSLHKVQRGEGSKRAEALFRKVGIRQARTILGLIFGITSGVISGQSLVFAKSGVTLIWLTLVNGRNQFTHFLTWFIVVALVVTAVMQLYYLNKGLRLCDTVLLVPLSFCAFNVSTLLNGLVYDQWDQLAWYQILLVFVGVAIVLCGVLVISWRPSDQATPEEEALLVGEEEDEGEVDVSAIDLASEEEDGEEWEAGWSGWVGVKIEGKRRAQEGEEQAPDESRGEEQPEEERGEEVLEAGQAEEATR